MLSRSKLKKKAIPLGLLRCSPSILRSSKNFPSLRSLFECEKSARWIKRAREWVLSNVNLTLFWHFGNCCVTQRPWLMRGGTRNCHSNFLRFATSSNSAQILLPLFVSRRLTYLFSHITLSVKATCKIIKRFAPRPSTCSGHVRIKNVIYWDGNCFRLDLKLFSLNLRHFTR